MTSSPISVEDFAASARKFLEANAERKQVKTKFTWGEGTDNVSMFEERSRDAEAEMLAKAKDWQSKRFDAGFAWITGPTEFGGAGLTPVHERAYNAVEREYRTAPLGAFQIGLGMVAPTIWPMRPKARRPNISKQCGVQTSLVANCFQSQAQAAT